MKRFPWYRLAFSLLGTVSLVHCQQPAEHEARLRQAMPPIDTVAVTSYAIDRENHAALADWRGIQDGNERLAFPPEWRDTVQDQTLVITPGQHPGGDEVLTFARFDRAGATRPVSEHLAQQAAQRTFPRFAVQRDSLKELVFQRGFAYERTADLRKAGTHYRGCCLLYADDRTFYQYTLVLSQQRLRAYDGNLIGDLVGNLKIDNHYFLATENPLQQIILLKP